MFYRNIFVRITVVAFGASFSFLTTNRSLVVLSVLWCAGGGKGEVLEISYNYLPN